MQFQHTEISGAQMNHYLRQGRLERSLAMRAMLNAGFVKVTRIYHAIAGNGEVLDRAVCTR